MSDAQSIGKVVMDIFLPFLKMFFSFDCHIQMDRARTLYSVSSETISDESSQFVDYGTCTRRLSQFALICSSWTIFT